MGYVKITAEDGTVIWLQDHMIHTIRRPPDGPVIVEFGGYAASDREVITVTESLDTVMERIRHATEGDTWTDANSVTWEID